MAKLIKLDYDQIVWDTIFEYIEQLSDVRCNKYGFVCAEFLELRNTSPAEVGSGKIFISTRLKDIIKYQRQIEAHSTESTVRSKLSVLKRCFKLLFDSGVITKTPFALHIMPEVSDTPMARKIIEFKDILKLIKAPNSKTIKGKRDSAILALLFGCMLRPSELSKAKRKDFYKFGDHYVLYLHKTKNGKSYEQPVPDQIAKIVLNYLSQQEVDSEYLFTSVSNNKKSKKGLTTQHITKIFKHYAKQLGYEGSYSSYSARATGISKMLFDGMHPRDAQKISRHSRCDTLMIYERKINDLKDSPAYKIKF